MSEVVETELRSLYGDDPRALDRRTFIVTSLSADFAAAVMPVTAQTITTPTDGLTAGEVKVPTKDGMMVAYRSTTALFYDVAVGERTRVTGLFDLDLNLREFKQLPKTIHFPENNGGQ